MNIESLQEASQRLAAEPLSKGFEPEGIHTYTDERGHPILSRIRYKHPQTGEKWIRPIHLSESGYILGEPTLKEGKPLYLLPNLVENTEDTIWITEGEKCADTLRKLGFTVTTSGSVGSVNGCDWSALQKRRVIIWPDNDEAGLRYASDISEILRSLDCEIQWIDIEKLSLPPKGDVVDWIQENPQDTLEKIKRLPLKKFYSSEWDPIEPFDERETPEIPTSLLPGFLGDFGKALSIATETPESLCTMAILGVLSACLSKEFSVSPKNGWFEPVNLYILTTLPPGNLKTAVLNACSDPLIEWEKDQLILLTPQIDKKKSERKTKEKRIEFLRSQAAKEVDKIKERELIREIADIENALPQIPVAPQIFANDATPEALVSNLQEQEGKFAIITDEGGILEVLSGLYSNGSSNIDVLLKGINGGHVRVRRKGKSIDLNPFLTILILAQPIILNNLNFKKSFKGNGFIERFLYVIPKSKLGYRTHDTPPLPDDVRELYNRKIRSLLEIKGESENKGKARVLTLSNESLEEWKTFQRVIEKQLREDGRFAGCKGWAGKICGYTLRIAGLLHVAQYGIDTAQIEIMEMTKAIEIASLLTEHALVAFNEMAPNPITQDAKEVLRWIHTLEQSSFTQTEATRSLRNKEVGKSERLKKALQTLIERNYIGEPRRRPTRKPTIYYEINPQLLK